MKIFLKKYIFSLLILASSIAMINIVVDPYSIFEIVKIKKFNDNKPFQSNYEQLYKPIKLFRVNPDIVVLGSSVAQSLYDPLSIQKVSPKTTAFNFGIDGPSIYELYNFFNFAINNTESKKFIISLELMMFNGRRDKSNSRFNINRMESDLSSSLLDYLDLKEVYDATLSFKTLLNSLKTILFQDHPVYYDENGFISKQTVNNENNLNFEKIFHTTKDAYLRSIENKNLNETYFYSEDNDNLINYFQEIVSLAYENDIELEVVISPMHQYFMDGVKERNLYETYLIWNQKIVDIIHKESYTNNRQPFNFFDYSFDKRNQEKITNTYTEKMIYWNDSYHPSVNYGNEIIEEILN